MKIATLLLFLLLISQNTFAQTATDEIALRAFELMRENKLGEAIAEIGKEIAIEPKNPSRYIARANIYRMAKDQANARKDAEFAIQLDPGSEKTLLLAVRVLQTGSREDCERNLGFIDAFLATSSGSASVYGSRGMARSCLGDTLGAFADMSRAAELDPTETSYQNNRANMISRLGDDKKALELYQVIIDELKPKIIKEKGTGMEGHSMLDLRGIYRSRAAAHERMGNMDLAIEDLTKGVELYEDENSLKPRYDAYRKTGRLAEAIADLSKMIVFSKKPFLPETTPPVAPFAVEGMKRRIAAQLFERSTLFTTLGKYQEALADLKECLEYDPSVKDRIEKRIAEVKSKQANAFAKPK
ncbi:MAG TPA: hypothetical protein PLP21_14960 [Pyrinomonadaceae bacterium]|nr:hypothetical protein [Acidobacteriota bacterium]HQZ97620.1 hypothetical protein [Pyrinomonadaceae bacterium]